MGGGRCLEAEKLDVFSQSVISVTSLSKFIHGSATDSRGTHNSDGMSDELHASQCTNSERTRNWNVGVYAPIMS